MLCSGGQSHLSDTKMLSCLQDSFDNREDGRSRELGRGEGPIISSTVTSFLGQKLREGGIRLCPVQ